MTMTESQNIFSRAAAWLACKGLPVTPRYVCEKINRVRLRLLMGRHTGRRCFVIGNGPSLRIEDLERLRGEITIASNKIYLAFEQTDWRPTYYTCIDEVTARNNAEAIRALALRKFYSAEAAPYLSPNRRACVVNSLPHLTHADGSEEPGFSDDLRAGAYGGSSVVYLGLQLAAHLGMREVYLLGVDFDFKGGEATDESLPYSGRVLKSAGERNHFHPDYYQPGERWTEPRLDLQRNAFAIARDWFDAHGGQLRNASRETKLDVLERVELDELLPK